MKTLVFMPACNEADIIGRSLDRMDASMVEPVVLVNGSTDKTAEVARQYGASVLEFEQKGKLPAIQAGLRSLGERALEPVLLTDADSYPLFSRHWSRTMEQSLEATDGPSVVSGLHTFRDVDGATAAYRTLRRYQSARQARSAEETSAVFGCNMGIKLGSAAVLEAVLEMPHIWPGEDRAMADNIIDLGGSLTQLTNAKSTVVTSARSHTSIVKRLTEGRTAVREEVDLSYAARSADTATHKYIDGHLIELHLPSDSE